MLWDALTLQLGYNATLVTLGAMMLGVGAGATGTYLYLSKRWCRMRSVMPPCPASCSDSW